MTERAVSTAVGYALILGIVMLLLSILLTGFGPLVTQQETAATHATLEVVGNDLAGDLESADRLATYTTGTVTLRTDLPDRVGGSAYTIDIQEIDPDANGKIVYAITLHSSDHDRFVTVNVAVRTPIDETAATSLRGGPLVIDYDDDTLVISHG